MERTLLETLSQSIAVLLTVVKLGESTLIYITRMSCPTHGPCKHLVLTGNRHDGAVSEGHTNDWEGITVVFKRDPGGNGADWWVRDVSTPTKNSHNERISADQSLLVCYLQRKLPRRVKFCTTTNSSNRNTDGTTISAGEKLKPSTAKAMFAIQTSTSTATTPRSTSASSPTPPSTANATLAERLWRLLQQNT